MSSCVLLAEAAYRFFKTKSEEDSLKRSGKSEVKKVARRRQEHISRVSTIHVHVHVYVQSTFTHVVGYCIHTVYNFQNLNDATMTALLWIE